MTIRPTLLIVVLLFLSACASSGYQRSYISLDETEEQVSSESAETPL